MMVVFKVDRKPSRLVWPGAQPAGNSKLPYTVLHKPPLNPFRKKFHAAVDLDALYRKWQRSTTLSKKSNVLPAVRFL